MKLLVIGKQEAYGYQDLLRQFYGATRPWPILEEGPLHPAMVLLETTSAQADGSYWVVWAHQADWALEKVTLKSSHEQPLQRRPDFVLALDKQLKAQETLWSEALAQRDQSLAAWLRGDRSGSESILAQWGAGDNLKGDSQVSEAIRLKRNHKRHLYQALVAETGRQFPWGSLTGIRPTLMAQACLNQAQTEIELRSEDKKPVTRQAQIFQRAHQLLTHDYGVLENKAQLALVTAQEEKRILRQLRPQTAAAYLHIPYCPSRCIYCSFSTPEGIAPTSNGLEAYLKAVDQELKGVYEAGIRPEISTLYIGGGTPGILSAAQINQLSTSLNRYLNLSADCEKTFEAGRPDCLDRATLEALKKNQFTKISINPQTFNQDTLDRVHRCHPVEAVYEAYALAREMGFESINMDLILGLPQEGEVEMRHSLREIERLAPDAFTVHCLAVKRSSDLNKARQNQSIDLSDLLHQRVQMLETLQEEAYRCAQTLGLVPYYLYRQKEGVGGLENLGYARPGQGNRYNLAMMGDGLSVLAFGAGAMSKRVEGSNVTRAANVKSLSAYLQRTDEMVERKRQLFQEVPE